MSACRVQAIIRVPWQLHPNYFSVEDIAPQTTYSGQALTGRSDSIQNYSETLTLLGVLVALNLLKLLGTAWHSHVKGC